MLRIIPVVTLMVGGTMLAGAFALGVTAGLVYRDPLRRTVKSTMRSMYQASQQFREKTREEFEDARAEAAASHAGDTTSGIH